MNTRINDIKRLYKLILNRDADIAGLRHYASSKLTLVQIQHALCNSNEFKNNENVLNSRRNEIEKSPIDNNIPIYVINLKRRPDRKHQIETRLNNLGIKNYNIIEAVDSRNLTQEDLSIKYNDNIARELRRYMPSAEIACALSHIKIANKIINDNLPYAIVLEDDVQLTLDFKKFLKQFDITKEYNFDFLLLGLISSNHVLNSKLKTTDAPHRIIEHNGITYLSEVEYNIGQFNIHSPHYPSMYIDYIHGTHAYVLSNAGARKVLEKNYPVVVQSDNVFNYFSDYFNVNIINPLIVHTTYEDSDLAGHRDPLEHDFSLFSKSFLKRYLHQDYGT